MVKAFKTGLTYLGVKFNTALPPGQSPERLEGMTKCPEASLTHGVKFSYLGTADRAGRCYPALCEQEQGSFSDFPYG